MNSKIRDYCLNILSKRDYTEYELRKKLKKKFENKNFDEIVSYLKSYGYIDDEKFLNNFTLNKFKAGYGQYYIQHKLFEKGIRVSLEKIVEIISEEYDIEEKIKEILKKKGIMKNTSELAVKKRYFDFLLRRGFDTNSIHKVMQEVLKNESNFYQ